MILCWSVATGSHRAPIWRRSCLLRLWFAVGWLIRHLSLFRLHPLFNKKLTWQLFYSFFARFATDWRFPFPAGAAPGSSRRKVSTWPSDQFVLRITAAEQLKIRHYSAVRFPRGSLTAIVSHDTATGDVRLRNTSGYFWVAFPRFVGIGNICFHERTLLMCLLSINCSRSEEAQT